MKTSWTFSAFPTRAQTDKRAESILLRAAAHLSRYAQALYGFVGDKDAPFGVYGSVLTKDKIVYEEFSRLLKARYPEIKLCVSATDSETAAALYAWRNMA